MIMRRLYLFLLFLTLAPYTYGQDSSMPDDDYVCDMLYSADPMAVDESPRISMSNAYRIRRNDKFLAFVPGAVQLRREWPTVAYSIWGGMAVAGGIAVYEQSRIVKLRNGADRDPYNANWYDNEIRQAKKVRNGSLIALGGVYVANYVSALLLPDRDPRTSWIVYTDTQGTIGLTCTLNF